MGNLGIGDAKSKTVDPLNDDNLIFSRLKGILSRILTHGCISPAEAALYGQGAVRDSSLI